MNKEVKSAARVLDLLEFLSSREEPVRFTEIGVQFDMPKSSLHGLLQTLISRGYVTKDGGDRYAVVDNFRQRFGWVGGFAAMLRSIALPIIESVRDETGETVFVSVWTDRRDARLVCKAVSNQSIRFDSSNQASLSGHATVMGRILLAWRPSEDIEDYFANVEIVPVRGQDFLTQAWVREELAAIRERGYGEIVDPVVTGGAGVAAPVRDANGDVVAVVDLATVINRYTDRREIMRDAVIAAARRISQRLGWRSVAGTAQSNSIEERVVS